MANRRLLKRVLWWAQRAFFAVALTALGYCAFVFVDAWSFERRASLDLRQQRQSEQTRPHRDANPSAVRSAIGAGGLIGRIEISRLGLSAIIVEGTEAPTLRRAVGHIASTGLPGWPGNVGLAAHRDTLFRSLKDVRLNDIISVTTSGGEYRYRVVSTKIVPPTEVSVLEPDGGEVVTLVTCYPFYFVGSAPKRFIVRAERTT